VNNRYPFAQTKKEVYMTNLKSYNDKRDFKKTKEPVGKKSHSKTSYG